MATFQIPGGFPGDMSQADVMDCCQTPTKNPAPKKLSTPSSSSFKFTATNGKLLYPTMTSSPSLGGSNGKRERLSFIDDSFCEISYANKENTSFVNEMEHLQEKMFSSKLTSNVLSEFENRYEKVREDSIAHIQQLNSVTNEELMKRASNRYSTAHKARFNNMESISSHYAAIRARNGSRLGSRYGSRSTSRVGSRPTSRPPSRPGSCPSTRPSSRVVVSRAVSPVLSTPGEKHSSNEEISSASKRRRNRQGGVSEIVGSPTRDHQKRNLERENAQKKSLHQRGLDSAHSSWSSVSSRSTMRSNSTVSTATSSIPSPEKKPIRRSRSPIKPTPSIGPEHRIPSYLMPTQASLSKSASKGNLKHDLSHKSIKDLMQKSAPPKKKSSGPRALPHSRSTAQVPKSGQSEPKSLRSFKSVSSIRSAMALKPSMAPPSLSLSKGCSNLHSLLTRAQKHESAIPTSLSSRNLSSHSHSRSNSANFFPPTQMPKSRTASNIPRLMRPKSEEIKRSPTSGSLRKWRY